MTKGIIIYEKTDEGSILADYAKEILIRKGVQVAELEFCMKYGGKIACQLSSNPVDIIISINWTGFQMSTMLENSLYNILPAKQLHIVGKKDLFNAHEKDDFALNLYIALPKYTEDMIQMDHTDTMPHIISHCEYERNGGVIIPSTKNEQIVERIINFFLRQSGINLGTI